MVFFFLKLQLAKANASQYNSLEINNPSIQLPQKIEAALSVTFKGKKNTHSNSKITDTNIMRGGGFIPWLLYANPLALALRAHKKVAAYVGTRLMQRLL